MRGDDIGLRLRTWVWCTGGRRGRRGVEPRRLPAVAFPSAAANHRLRDFSFRIIQSDAAEFVALKPVSFGSERHGALETPESAPRHRISVGDALAPLQLASGSTATEGVAVYCGRKRLGRIGQSAGVEIGADQGRQLSFAGTFMGERQQTRR